MNHLAPVENDEPMLVLLAILFFTIAATGCSSAERPGDAPPADSGIAFGHDIVLTMSLTVPPLQELHLCQFAELPNDADVEAVSFSHLYTAGSHHFLVIATDLDTIPADMRGQYDCTYGNEPIMVHSRGVIYGAQTPEGHFPLPAGVGFRMTAKQVVILQAHYLNLTALPIDAHVQFGMDLAAPGSIQQEAGFMFFYDPFIYLPPQGTATSGISCPVSDDINIVSASSHYHQRGTGMSVWIDGPDGSRAANPFFETRDWQHSLDFRGQQAVPAGSQVRFQCEYLNADPSEVFEGPNAKTSEMCVFGGLYYPKRTPSFENCQHMSVLGSGAASCNDLMGCFRACRMSSATVDAGSAGDTRSCQEKCVATGCPGATDALLILSSCAQRRCSAACAMASCDACLAAECAPELGACSAHTCSP